MGLLLRTKRHTATGKQIQVLVAAVNRHMPATPSRCCRRRRGRTRSTFPGGNPGARAMIPRLPPRPPTSSGSTWRGHGRASTAAMTWSLVGVVTWFLPRNRNEGRRSRPQIPEYSRRAGSLSHEAEHRLRRGPRPRRDDFELLGDPRHLATEVWRRPRSRLIHALLPIYR